jgi:xanthine dehydrogenase molybdopterin-binding subunit B
MHNFQVFCGGKVKYAGQPLGLIVAETEASALNAVTKVKVEYSNVSSPCLNMRNIIASGDKTRIRVDKEPDTLKKDGKHKFKKKEIILVYELLTLPFFIA